MALGVTPTTLSFIAGNGTPAPSAGVTDVLQNGVSVVENGVARVTVPTNTSDLQNDSGFVTAGDIRQVPASTSADSGKVLTVDSQGNPGWATGGSGGGVPTPVGAFHCYLRSNDDDTGYTWAHLWEPLEREASLSIIDGDLAYIFTDPIKLRTYKWMCPWYASSRQFMCNLRCDIGVDLADTYKTVYVQPALALYAAHYNTMPPGWVYTHSRIQEAAMSRVPVVQSTISGATHQLLDVSLSMPMAFPGSYWNDGWYNYFEGFRFKIYDEDGDPITLSAVNYSTVTNLYAMAP